MAEMRRPNRGVPSRNAAGAGRRPAPQPERKPTPKLVWVGLVVSVFVLGGLIWNLTRPTSSEAPEAKVTVDPNARIRELVNQVPGLQAELRAWLKLMKAEDPAAKAKQEALKARLDKWNAEWDSIFEPQRDADNKLPASLAGYQSTKTRVNQLCDDLAKSSGL